MEINLTDKQINELVEKTFKDYILSKYKKKIDEVMKAKYHFHQSISDEMKRAIHQIMRDKIDSALTDKELSKFIDVNQVTEEVSSVILQHVSDTITEALMEKFNY